MRSDATSGASDGGRFETTRWSLILGSLGGNAEEEKAREALAHLCRTYWRPIFAFVCRRGHSVPDAQDLTQEFFLMVLKGNLLAQADPARGRFRSLLLKALQNFLIDEHGKAGARKRGGQVQFVAWDQWMAEAPSRLAIAPAALDSWPAERVFDVRWAATVAERALSKLREECEAHGRRRIFDAISDLLAADREDVSYDAPARELGVETADIKRVLHRMRQRYRKLLREEVADTVERLEDVDDELRYLVAALAAGIRS